MPIRIPDSLPATEVLEGENIFVMTEYRAMHQDIRPLKVLLLNLMPTKIVTETQIMRKLSNTPLQIEVSLLQTASHEAKNVSEQHLDTFYTTFDEIKDQRFDGMIITGAPVELLDFEDVDYWDELARIMDWSATNVHSTFHICWGAQAGIYHHYGIPKYELENKLFGVFDHPEYDADTLMAEYERDIAKGLDMPLPRHYFPNDDPTQAPRVTWRAHAQLLYTNWLNYYVYQTTPYDLAKVGTEEDSVHE